MIRVVLDSNIYISALNFRGLPLQVLELAEQQNFQVFLSAAIHAELQRVLTKKFHWQEEAFERAWQKILGFTQLITRKSKINVTADPDDNRILECALDAKAQVIVTGDDDLLRLKQFENIRILTVRQFLNTKMWQSK